MVKHLVATGIALSAMQQGLCVALYCIIQARQKDLFCCYFGNSLSIPPGWRLCLARNHLSPLLFSKEEPQKLPFLAVRHCGDTYSAAMQEKCSHLALFFLTDDSFLVNYFLHSLNPHVWSPSASSFLLWTSLSPHLTSSVTVTHYGKHAVSGGSKCR